MNGLRPLWSSKRKMIQFAYSCVDYQRLNAMTQVDVYPMPRIDGILDQVDQIRYITTLDLAKGYWQISVAEEGHPKTVFITPRWLYQFKMMLFSLYVAPATLQRMMDQVIRGAQVCQCLLGWSHYLQYIKRRSLDTPKNCTKLITAVGADN